MTIRFTITFLLFFPVLIWGQFGSQQPIYKGTGTTNESAAADFNQDGYLDIAIGTRRHLIIYEGTAIPLEFKERIISDGAVLEVEVSDMDSDGDTDIFTVKDGKPVLFKNEGGDYNFEEYLLDDESVDRKGILHIELVDIYQDGYTDVLLINEPYSHLVFISIDASNTIIRSHKNLLNLPEFNTNINFTDLPLSIALMDYNQDEVLDIALSHHKADSTQIYFFNIKYSSPTIIDSLQTNDPIKNINSADFDQDGDKDLLVATEKELYWLKMKEDGLTERVDIPLNFQQENITKQVEVYSRIMDWNQDDLQDICYYSYATDEAFEEYEQLALILYNNGDDTFSNNPLYEPPFNKDLIQYAFGYPQLSNLQVVDINRDEHLDWLITTNHVRTILGNDERELTEEYCIRKIEIDILGAWDTNQDGFTDIATFSEDGGNVSFWINDGQQNFVEDTILNNITHCVGGLVRARDMNGDGLPDILVDSLNSFNIYESKPEGGFSEPIFVNHYADHLADINGDNRLDNIFWDRPLRECFWMENTPNGFSEWRSFSFSMDSNTSQKPNRWDMIDMDGDKLADLVSYRFNGDLQQLLWYKGDGNGHFAEQEIIASSPTLPFRDYKFFHLNGDSKPDILFYEPYGTKHDIFINNGGSFTHSELQFDEDIPTPLFYGFIDLQGDGLDELLTLNDLYLNTGNAFEKIENVLLSSFNSYEDLDGDGDNDLIGVRTRDYLYWQENLLGNTRIISNAFFDENQNGIFDVDEFLLFDIPSQFLPDTIQAFPSLSSGKTIYYPYPGSYELTLHQPENWKFTTDSIYQIEIEKGDALDYYFGLYPLIETSRVQPSITSSPTRCGFEVDFWLNYTNEGYISENGEVSFVLDERTSLVKATPRPSRRAGSTLYWAFEDLKPTYKEQVRLTIQIPGVDAIGDTLNFFSQVFKPDVDGVLQLINTHTYRSEVRCAYDPNDKLVLPNRAGDENYTLFDETLEYTIRFQNTGTDTAFNIVIRDYLDKNLDWTSFKPLNASHTFETSLNDKTGLVEFSFRNILLPDSIVNEPASHGYVKYSIKANEGLDENTTIQNTANIFFDFNPPIQTNTIQNTMVSKLPKSEEEQAFRTQVKAFPNPFSQSFYIDIFSTNRELDIQDFLLFDNIGRLVLKVQMSGERNFQIDTNSLPAGIYFYSLVSESEIVANGKLICIP